MNENEATLLAYDHPMSETSTQYTEFTKTAIIPPKANIAEESWQTLAASLMRIIPGNWIHQKSVTKNQRHTFDFRGLNLIQHHYATRNIGEYEAIHKDSHHLQHGYERSGSR